MANKDETQKLEKKSIKILKFDGDGNFKPQESDYKHIIKPCVAFANSFGGKLIIGIEDGKDLPEQIISNLDLPSQIKYRISLLTHNVGCRVEIKRYENGFDAIEIEVFKSESTIASTNEGRYYIRSADNSVPLMPDELSRFLTDKPSFIWETKKTKIPKDRIDDDKLRKFISDIKYSKTVSDNVKQKSDEEILEHYFFIDGDFLTNLGVLWVGSRKDRGNISYIPNIQFIKYDERDQKVNKITWDHYALNPKELLESALKDIPDWKEGVEVPQGMFRKFIPNYSEIVLREIIVNALIHRPYSQNGEILISLYQDRLEITNPGKFPIGVTEKNLLHKSIRRNEKMADIFYSLGLMEAEGTGIDKVYENLLVNGKKLPIIYEGEDFVKVIIEKTIIKTEVIALMEKAITQFPSLKQKELTSLGLIAESGSISALEFQEKLCLDASPTNNPTKQWLGELLNLEIVKSKGKTKGVEYFINPEFLRKNNFKGKTTLKNTEGHRLEELVRTDLEIYKWSSVGEIHERLGGEREIKIRTLRAILSKMRKENLVQSKGQKRWVKYSININ